MATLGAIQCLSANVVSLFLITLILEFFNGVHGQQIAKFTADPQPKVVRLGENVSLRCTVWPPMEVFWMVNGFPLISNTSYVFNFDRVTGEHEVIIKNITLARDGKYLCRTQNANPKPVSSQAAQVTVIVPPTEIKLVPFNPTTIVQENVETFLTCQSNGAKPAPMVQWFKDDTLVENGVDTQVFTSEATKIENVTSTLKWIPSRSENEKRIYCTASHPALQGGPLKFETLLAVEYAPTVKIASVPEIVKEGESVTLQCIVDANPYIDLKFRWTKNGLPMPDAFGGSLFIEKAERTERPALYTCEATNKIGTNSAGFLLDVQYPPTFYSMLEVRAGELNTDIFLSCNVDSNPTAVISWVHESSSEVIGRESTLQIHPKYPSDFGIYVCIANTPGFPAVRKEIRIVQKGPPFISAEASVYGGVGDASAQIKCVVNGLPVAESVRWSNPQGQLLIPQSDGRIDISKEILLDRVISRLTIKNIRKEDFGMYNCSASNAYGDNERLIPFKETDWMLPVIIGCACGGGFLLTVIVITAILCIKCRSHNRLKQTSDTSGSTTTSDDLEVKSATGLAHGVSGHLDIYNASSSETLTNTKHNSWVGSNNHQQEILQHSNPYTIHGDYGRKDMQNYYTRYADYEQEYNPGAFIGVPAMYTPTMSITDHHEQEGSRDPSPYHASGLPRMDGVYGRHPAIMLDATLSNRLATNV